jgi:hypothetical protein
VHGAPDGTGCGILGAWRGFGNPRFDGPVRRVEIAGVDSDDLDRRRAADRRTGPDRRTGHDRRAPEPPAEDSPLRYVGPERRAGTDRRRDRDRRSGLDRRDSRSPRDQISRALDLVAYVAESSDLADEDRRALDGAILRLRFALSHLDREE